MVTSLGLSLKHAEGSRIYQYLSAITGTLGIVCSEMHYGWPSPTLPALMNGSYYFLVTNEEGSWLVIMPLIGAIIGAAITGLIIDNIGRKKLILLSSVPFFIAWLMIGLARSPTLLFISRFLAGMTDGLSFTAVPMYLGEIADPKIRGLLASFCPVSVVLGVLLINILGSFLPIPTTAFIASGIPVLLLCTFAWMPESPYSLLMKNRHEEARKSLQKLRGVTDVEKELNRLAKAVKEQSENTGKFVELFTASSNRKAVFIALGLRTVQQLTGITAIIYYCKSIFEEAPEFLSPSLATITFFSIQLLLSAVSSLIVDISGRRPLLLISITGSALALFANGTYLYIQNCTDIDTSSFSFVPLIALISFTVIFSVGLQTIPLMIMGELFPTNVKAFALSLADVYFSVIASVVSKFFHMTTDAFGMHVPFFTFFLCCVVGLFFVYFFVPETKGKTLEDIQLYLKGEIEQSTGC